MGEVLILDRTAVDRLLEVEPLLDALENAFLKLSSGDASVPPRVAARTPFGLLGAMPGYVEGAGLASKLVTVFPGNDDAGHPSHQGIIALFDEQTGSPLAVMDGIRITALRTAAATAVATRHLAREDASVMAVLGAGVQGRAHLETVPRVRALTEVRIASRTPAHARALAEEAPPLLAAADRDAPGAKIVVSGSFEEAVRGADIVCACTDAHHPVIEFEWLTPGAHVNSVGGSHGRELDAATVYRGKLFVEWRGAVTSPPLAGAGELQGMDPDTAVELGELLAGRRSGRASDQEITVYKSTGHAVEDVAAARLVYDRAVSAGLGERVSI